VYIQHHGAPQALAASTNTALASEWLPELCAGRHRTGVALAGARPGPSLLHARPAPGGWWLEGSAPWVTGWGLVDAVLTLARTADQQLLSLLVDATESDTLRAVPVQLMACNASRTVELRLSSHFVPAGRVVSIEPYAAPPAHDGGGRSNGSLALGVARRACLLLGPTQLDAELALRRERLDTADARGLAGARAAAVELALRASAALITHSGSRSIAGASHAQRLAREALFLLVFGSRPAIASALLEQLGAGAPRSH
jgi:alkylation response protein AidB-like acyl-CoA dehydrogenase